MPQTRPEVTGGHQRRGRGVARCSRLESVAKSTNEATLARLLETDGDAVWLTCLFAATRSPWDSSSDLSKNIGDMGAARPPHGRLLLGPGLASRARSERGLGAQFV